jgi:2,4-dienoyl-CoA reductase (NADPH2)
MKFPLIGSWKMKFKANYQKLLEPGYIGKLRIRNRLIKTAAIMSYTAADDPALDRRTIAFYEALAKGGVGLIIVESACVDFPLGGAGPRTLHIDDDRYIPIFAELAQAAHKQDCPIFMSLLHAGPIHGAFTGLQPVAASARTAEEMPQGPRFSRPPRELTVEEIQALIERFVDAAERVKKAGFDGVEFINRLIIE